MRSIHCLPAVIFFLFKHISFPGQQFPAIRLLHIHVCKLHSRGGGDRGIPLNRNALRVVPDGEWISWVIVESRAGLQNVRAIAAVQGIGVLRPGAGTLRHVFSKPGADGRVGVDEVA